MSANEEQKPQKVFTLQEANHMLPVLTRHIRSLHRLRDLVLGLEVEIDVLELITDEKTARSAHLEQKLKDYNQLVEEFHEVVSEIHSLGCYLKDPNSGLIDFYGMREGRKVFFCWKFGESEIGHWHEVERGYKDRRPLQPMDGAGDTRPEDIEGMP